MSPRNLDSIRDLAARGAEFAHIPHPSFLRDERLENLEGNGDSRIQFFVVANHGPVDIMDLRLRVPSLSDSDIHVSHLAPHSTLLVPEAIETWDEDEHRFTSTKLVTIDEASFQFFLGDHRLSRAVEIGDPMAEVVVFEIGLGEIGKALIDFEDAEE